MKQISGSSLMGIGVLEGLRRKFCERIRNRLFRVIDRCMDNEERKKLIDATEEAISKALRYEKIEEHKEELFDTVSHHKEYTNDIEKELSELRQAYGNLYQSNHELAEAIRLLIWFYDQEAWEKLGDFIRMLKNTREIGYDDSI